MRYFISILLLSALFYACEANKENSNDESAATVSGQDETVVPNQVATIEIGGMACVMSCGGSIKKALRKTDGVSTMEFDFEADRETNILTVSYNDELVKIEEIKKIISELNDKQFTVGEISSKNIHTNTSTSQKSCPYTERTTIEAVSSSFEMPSLIDVLSSLLPG